MRCAVAGLLILLTLIPRPAKAKLQGKPFIDSLVHVLSLSPKDKDKAKAYFELCVVYSNNGDTVELLKNAEAWLRLGEKMQNSEEIVYAYNYLGEAYCQKQDYGKAVLFGKKGLDLSRKARFKGGESFSLQNLGNFYYYAGDTLNNRKYREQAHDFGLKTGDKKSLSELYYRWGLDLANKGDYQGCIGKWTQALQLKEEIGEPGSNTLNSLLHNIGQAYMLLHDGASAGKYFNRLLQQGIIDKDTETIGQGLFFMGRAYDEAKEYSKAVEYSLKAFNLFGKRGDHYWMALSLNQVGSSYFKAGLYDRAAEYQLKSLKISETVNDATLYPSVLNDLTLVYEKIGQYDKALGYLIKSKAQFEKSGEKWYVGKLIGNIGIIYRNKGEYSKSLASLRESVRILDSLDRKDDVSGALNEMGTTYYMQGEYAMALNVYYQAQRINQSLNDQGLVAMNLGNIGKTYLQIARNKGPALPDSLSRQPAASLLRKSIDNLGRAISIAREQKLLDHLLENYEHLSVAQEMNGDYKAALESYKLKTMYQDSLFSNEKIRSITSLDMQYDFDKKEAAIKAENNKRAALAAAANAARIRTGIIIALGLIVILLVIFYFNRKRVQARIKLQQLQLKQEAARARLDTHFVSDAMMAINEFIEDNNNEAASDYLLRFSRLIRNVLNNSFETAITLEEDIKFLDDYFRLASLKYPEGHISYELQVDKQIIPSETLVPPMVFQVLVENALQHAFSNQKGGKLLVSVHKEGNMLRCTVADNGIGRKAAQEVKKEQRTSYGTSLAERLVRTGQWAKGATFSIEDSTDAAGNATGTKAVFSFPLITY